MQKKIIGCVHLFSVALLKIFMTLIIAIGNTDPSKRKGNGKVPLHPYIKPKGTITVCCC